MKTCTIYGLFSTRSPEEIRYIGQTTRPIKERLNQHRSVSRLRGRTAVQKWAAREIADGYSIELKVLTRDAVFNVTEKSVIAEYRAIGARLLNLTDGGEGTIGWHGHAGKPKPWLADLNRVRCAGNPGRPMSDENKAKIIAALTGKKRPELVLRNKTNHPWIGKKHSEETRAKMSESAKRVVKTEEWCRNISKGKKGAKLSPDHLEKFLAGQRAHAESARGKSWGPMPEATKEKIRAAMIGRVFSEETRKKLSESLKGRVFSPETIERMRSAARARAEKKKNAQSGV